MARPPANGPRGDLPKAHWEKELEAPRRHPEALAATTSPVTSPSTLTAEGALTEPPDKALRNWARV